MKQANEKALEAARQADQQRRAREQAAMAGREQRTHALVSAIVTTGMAFQAVAAQNSIRRNEAEADRQAMLMAGKLQR
ncbi:hypothetical protein HAQ06_10090 [Pseudomonas sp. C2L12B]|nr:hypothetical protein [Pseudomonas typographi]